MVKQHKKEAIPLEFKQLLAAIPPHLLLNIRGEKARKIAEIGLVLKAVGTNQAIIYPLSLFEEKFPGKIKQQFQYIRTQLKSAHKIAFPCVALDNGRIVIWQRPSLGAGK